MINYKILSIVIMTIVSVKSQTRSMEFEINEALSYLNEADELMDSGSYIDVVLIIGKNSIANSALASLFGSDNENLISREIQNGNDTKFIIENINPTFRRVNSNWKKKKLFPELIYNAINSTAYYDCSGFSESLNKTMDIISLHFLRKILLHSENIKIVYVLDYTKLNKEDGSTYLVNSLKFIGSFVVNIEKYSESISFVIILSDNDLQQKDDEVIKSIINLIPKAKNELLDMTSNGIAEPANSTENAIVLTDIMNSNRIGILHWPNEPGLLSDNKRIQEDKVKLLNMIDSTVFVLYEYDDFNYRVLNLTYETLINNITENIQLQICFDIEGIALKAVNEYEMKEKNFIDFRELKEEFIEMNEIFIKWKKNLTESKSTERLLLSALEFLNETYVPNADNNIFNLFRFHDFLNFLKIINFGKLKLKMFECFDLPMSTKYFNESVLIYTFLYNTYHKLGEWQIQNNKAKYAYDDLKIRLQEIKLEDEFFFVEGVEGIIFKDIIEKIYDPENDILEEDVFDLDYDYFDNDNFTDSNSTLNNTDLYNNFTNENELIKVSGDILELIYNATFNDAKIDVFMEILDLAIDRVIRVNCLADDHISARGDYIKLSEIVDKKICPEPLKTIEIIAIYKVFIDTNFVHMGQGIKMSIIAPIWEVVRRSRIHLIGTHGAAHNQSKALNGPNGTFFGESGSNGEPGLPGRRGLSGGTFIGVADKIINNKILSVASIGGDGSAGQEGGDGSDGFEGLSPSLVAWVTYRRCEYRLAGGLIHTMFWKKKDTNNGGIGGNGANGGKGGYGGFASPVFLLEFSRPTSVKVNRVNGKDGKDGKGGKKGIGGWSGNHCKQKYKIYLLGPVRYTYYSSCNEKVQAGDGADGKNGENTHDMEQHEQIIVWDFSFAVNEYKGVIIDNLNQRIKFPYLIDFYDYLDTNPEINNLWSTLAFTIELNQMENRFYRLKDQIDFLPFYENYYDRLENYTSDKDNKLKREKAILSEKEQRKILCYLHSSCLSKICSFRDEDDSSLIINTKEYMNYVIGNINRLEKIQNKVSILELNEEYKKEIDSKIDKGYELIQDTIIAEIEKIQTVFENKLYGFLNEITTIQEKKAKEIKRLTKLKSDLQKNMILTIVLEALKFITETILTMTGVGKAAVGLVDMAFNLVEGAVLMDSNEDLKLNAGATVEINNNLKVGDTLMSKVDNEHMPILDKQIQILQDSGEPKLLGLTTRMKKLRDDIIQFGNATIELAQKEIQNEMDKLNNYEIDTNYDYEDDDDDDNDDVDDDDNSQLDSTSNTDNQNDPDESQLDSTSSTDNQNKNQEITPVPRRTTPEPKRTTPEPKKTTPEPKSKKSQEKKKGIRQKIKFSKNKKSTKADSTVKNDYNTAISNTKDAIVKGHQRNKEVKDRAKKKKLNRKNTKKKIKNYLKGKQEDTLYVLKIFKTVKATYDVGIKIGIGMMDKLDGNSKQIALVEQAIADRQRELQEVSNFKEKVKQELMPAMKGMISNLKENAKHMGTQSAVELDWAQFLIHDKINDMKRNLKLFTNGFEVSEDILLLVDRLSEVMDTLITTFQRLQTYKEQKKLGDYIANVASVGSSNIKIYDEFLNKAVLNLDLTIKSNIVLISYNSATIGLKQYLFPFADYYFREFQLPDNIVVDDTIEDLVDKAVTQLQIMQLKLIKTNAIIFRKHDQYLEDSEFGYDDDDFMDTTEPFFTWKNAEYFPSIFNLLSGKYITLHSDVRKSEKSAVKFRQIELRFKAETKEKQIELDKILSNFLINITHMGTSNFRCNSKFYSISHQSETIIYSYAKNNNGQPKRTNHIYEKLKNNDFMLSPYGMWTMNLIPLKKRANYTRLRVLASSVTLEFIGYGQFIDNNADICNTHLEDYYKEDTTISTIVFHDYLLTYVLDSVLDNVVSP